MRRSMLVVPLLLVAVPAFAVLDKDEVKCRATIAGGVTKLVDASLKAVAKCETLRSKIKIAEDTVCTDLTNPNVDSKGKIAAAEMKLATEVAARCGGLDADVRARYVSCPAPCRQLAGVANPIGSYAEVAACLACGAKAFVTAEMRPKLGSPPVAPLTRNDVKCHGGIAKAVRNYDVAILKALTKCQSKADAAGHNDTAGCTAATDPGGAITIAQQKAEKAIDKACAAADLTHVGSCSSLSLDALKTCLGVPRAGFGGGSTLFEAMYDLAPSRGAVRGTAVLDLVTQEGATITLPGVALSLSVPGEAPVALATTNLRGEFSFPPVPLGSYQLCWDTPGYVPGCLADPVTVRDDTVRIAEPAMVAPAVTAAAGVIRGRALLADATPCPLDDPFLGAVQSAVVSATDGGSVVAQSPTNTGGDFVLIGVPQGAVTLHATCAGATVDVALPAPVELSGFSRVDLAWANHSPTTTDLQVTKNGTPAGVVQPGDTIDVSALVDDAESQAITHDWRIVDPTGALAVNGATATWTVPPHEGLHELYLSAHDDFGGFDISTLVVGCNALPYIVSAKALATQSSIPPWIGYPTSVFLTRKGVGSAAEACTYYNLVDPACADLDCNGTPDPSTFANPCKRITLGGWWEVNGFDPNTGAGGDVTRAFYENHNDLGFGREMNCRKAPSGNVACFVVNYGEGNQNPGNANLAYGQNPNCAKATVAMEWSPVEMYEGVGPIVKFFVYKGRGPGSPRLGGADLDGFGQKFVPNLCLNCHGGTSNLAGVTLVPFQFGSGFFGWLQILVAYFQRIAELQNIAGAPSSFLPFDLPTFRYPTALPQSAQEAQFKTLNAHVKDTNPALGIVDLVNGWYAGNSPTQITNYMPAGWTGSLASTDLYTKVVQPTCRTCHTAQPGLDFLTYSSMQSFTFFNVCPANAKAMPHAYITYKNFWLAGTGPTYLAGLSQTGNYCQ